MPVAEYSYLYTFYWQKCSITFTKLGSPRTVILHWGVSVGIVGERTSQSLQLPPLVFPFPWEDSPEGFCCKAFTPFSGLLLFTEVEKDWKVFPHHPHPAPGTIVLFGPGIVIFYFQH